MATRSGGSSEVHTIDLQCVNLHVQPKSKIPHSTYDTFEIRSITGKIHGNGCFENQVHWLNGKKSWVKADDLMCPEAFLRYMCGLNNDSGEIRNYMIWGPTKVGIEW